MSKASLQIVLAMTSRKEFLLNLITFFAARVIALGVFAFVVPIALHHLGAEGYTALTLVLIVIGFLPLLDAGLGYGFTFRCSRMYARRVSSVCSLLDEHMWLYAGGGILLASLLGIGLPWVFWLPSDTLGGNTSVLVSAVAATSLFVFLALYYRAQLVAFRRTYVANVIDGGSDLLRGAALLIGIGVFFDLTLSVILLAATYAMRWLVFAIAVTRSLRSPLLPRFVARRRSLRMTFRIGAPSAVVALITVAFGLVDKALLSRTISLVDLAPYVLASDLLAKSWMVVWAVHGGLAPILMRWRHSREHGKTKHTFLMLSVVTLVLAIGMYVPLNVFELQIIAWWVGKNMAAEARSYIALFSLASVLYFSAHQFFLFLQADGRADIIAKAMIVGFSVYLPALVFGIRIGGPRGAAGAHILLWLSIALVVARFYFFGDKRMAIR